MRLNEYKNRHKGQRCWIIGNGPSLNEIDLGLLKGETTFGTNRIYLKGFTPNYYVVCNPLVIDQFKDEIAKIQAVKFSAHPIPGEYIPLDTSLAFPTFSSPEGPMWEGYTVTYVALQLAYYMGFTEVYLVGCDHDYGPLQGLPNQEVTGGDRGHFDKHYFEGVKWNLPDLRMSEFAYHLAASAFARAGRKVVNCSAHTKLKAFPLLPFRHVVDRHAPKVSAIVSAYKAEKYIGGLLEDLACQTLFKSGEAEAVVACQFDSPEYAAVWAAKERGDLPIQIHATLDCPTVYKAWNLCVKEARGRYLTNANSDDRHHVKHMEMLAKVLDGREDLDLVYADCYVTWTDNQTLAEFLEANQGRECVPGRVKDLPGYFAWPDYQRATLKQGCYIGPQPMWRAALHQRYGPFDASFASAGDYDFWLRCAREGNYYHLPQFLGLYHASGSGVEMSDPGRAVEEALRAQSNNMAPGLGIQGVGAELFQLQIGGEITFAEREDFLDAYDHIRYGGNPKEPE